MTKRLAHAGLLFVEVAAIAFAAIVVAEGDLGRTAVPLGWLAAILAAVSLGVAFVLPVKRVARAAVHGTLIVGSIVFMFPFLWLVGTSFKYPEEVYVYPPKWIPSTPGGVRRSPYLTAELYDPVERPAPIPAPRWKALWPRLESALWDRAGEGLGAERTRDIDPADARRVVARGLWASVLPALSQSELSGDDAQILTAVTNRIDPDRIEEVWRSVYRCVALRAPFLTDTARREYAVSDLDARALERWSAESENVRLRRVALNIEGKADDSVLVEYRFGSSDAAVVSGVFPLPMPASDLLSVTLPIRQDRSWHRLEVALEFAGKRYVAEDVQFLQMYLWQEMTFKRLDRDNRDERSQGVWGLVPAADQGGAFREPGHFKIVLTLRRSSPVMAALAKFTQNYRSAWISGTHWDLYLYNSFYLVALTVIGQIVSCSLVAYAFARLKWPGRDVLFLILLGTMMLPGQVTMIPIFLVFKELGWYNTLKPLWVPAFLGTAFYIFMLRQFMKTIPQSLEEAARIDGCGYFGTFRQIMVPLIKPAVIAVGIFTFMGTWNEFMGPLIYVNDQRSYPLALGLFDLRLEFGGDFGMLMAASSLMVIPVVLLFFLAQRYFIEGVTLTGMKN